MIHDDYDNDRSEVEGALSRSCRTSELAMSGFRSAARQLLPHPSCSAVVIATLALGIGGAR